MLSFDMYSRKVLDEMQYEICDEGCHNGLIPFLYCGKAPALKDLRSSIVKKAGEDCACYAARGECPPGGLPQFCRDLGEFNPTWHRRRACRSNTGAAETTLVT